MEGKYKKIGFTGLKQICLVTRDLADAERKWTGILGIPAEHLVTPVWSQVPSYTNGKRDEFREEFLVFHLENGVLLEIYGPGKNPDNPWNKYLEKYGEGVMNLAFYVEKERQEAYRQIGKNTGVKKPYHEGFYPDCTYSFVGTQESLGVELNIKCEEDNKALIKVLNDNPKSYRNE